MIFRCALAGVLALSASSCFLHTDGPGSQYDGYVVVRFEPDYIGQMFAFLEAYFPGPADTVAVHEYFTYGPVSHCSTVAEDGTFTGGFALCIGLDTLTGPDRALSRYAVHDKYGHLESPVYAVFHDTTKALMPEHAIQLYVPNGESSCTWNTLCVQNVQAAVQAALYGTGLSGGPFTAEDHFDLTLTGYKDKTVTGTKTVRLIDGIRPLTEWTEVDVTGLGSIDAVDLTLTATRSDFPLYCCLDDEVFHYIEIY